MRLAAATMVDVFPVPGGPYNSKWGRLSLSIKFVMILIMSSWATKSSSLNETIKEGTHDDMSTSERQRSIDMNGNKLQPNFTPLTSLTFEDGTFRPKEDYCLPFWDCQHPWVLQRTWWSFVFVFVAFVSCFCCFFLSGFYGLFGAQ
jgi:hypothetical protein